MGRRASGRVYFVLVNSMLKYVINRLMHAFFHIRTVIIPRQQYQPSGQYRSLGMITILIWKRACITVLIWKRVCINNRLMHALFHIRTVITPRDRYWLEGLSLMVDIGRGKRACNKYRLIHGLLYISQGITPMSRYQPDTQSMVNMDLGMIAGLFV